MHFDTYLSAHEVIENQAKSINQLMSKVEEIGREVNATTIQGTVITWRHVGIGGISGSGVMLVIISMCCVYLHCKDRKLPRIHFFQQSPPSPSTNHDAEMQQQVAAGFELVQRTLQNGFNEIVRQQIEAGPGKSQRRSQRRSRNILIEEV